MAKKHELHGDRPLGRGDEDRLDFSAVAERLATAITDEASRSGFVIGLEGEWGSGKSSLLYLVVSALSAKRGKKRPILVNFQPWVVGERDALLTALFSELASAIEASDATATPDVTDIAKSAANKVRGFAARLGGVGQIIALADEASLGALPGLGPLGKILKSISDTASGLESKPSLSDAKDDLSETLLKLSHRIVVIIDDLDRLEPKEAMELLRLVRAVADFPNVVYVLCYDHNALARSIEKEAGVENGTAFLEKIIQVSVPIPRPGAFVLRRWFAEELAKFASAPTDATARLVSTIEVEGGRRLTTPRAVHRAVNAVRFVWPALSGSVDLGDLVWLQLVRQSNPVLYQWVERYCVTMEAVNAESAVVADDGLRHLFEDLQEALKLERQTYNDAWPRLAQRLPGISLPSNDKIPIAKRSSVEDLRTAAESRRLASPDHSRLYFSLIPATGAPTEEDFRSLSEASEDSAAALDQFLRQGLTTRRGSATRTELILDRFGSRFADDASENAVTNLLIALSNVMDDAALASGVGEWGRYWIWVTVDALLPKLITKLTNEKRAEILRTLFNEGAALGWLISIWRSALRAHSKIGKDSSPPPAILSPDELDTVTQILVSRFRQLAPEALEVPNFLQLLFTWGQSDTMDAPRRWLEPHIKSDEGLVRALESMSSWVAINDRVHFQLTRQNIEPFLDYEAARKRIDAIADDVDKPADLRERALKLKQKFEIGDDN